MFGKNKLIASLRDDIGKKDYKIDMMKREISSLKEEVENILKEKGWDVCPICGKRDEMKWRGEYNSTEGVRGKIMCDRCEISVFGEMKVVRAKWNKLRRGE